MKKVEHESLGAVHTHTHTLHLLNNKNGITLIALVITIIVLLILAGVSVAMLTGTNGILKKAQEAQERTKEAAEKEMQEIDELNKLITGDKENIEVNFNGYTPNTWTNKDITINLSMKNPQEGKYQYSNDKNTWIDCSSIIKINTDQTKTYYFRRIDSKGKLICETQGFEIKRDTEKPTFEVELSSNSNSITCKTTNIKDSGSGAENKPQISISYRKSSDKEYINAYTGTDNEYTITNIGEMFSNVPYVLKISVTDIANNKTTIVKKIETKTGEIYKGLRANGYRVNLSFSYNEWTEEWLDILYSDNYSFQDMMDKCIEEEKEESLEELDKCEDCIPVTSFFELVEDENSSVPVEKTEEGLYKIELEGVYTEENTNYYILSYNFGLEEFEVTQVEDVDIENHTLTFCIEDPSVISVIKDQ